MNFMILIIWASFEKVLNKLLCIKVQIVIVRIAICKFFLAILSLTDFCLY